MAGMAWLSPFGDFPIQFFNYRVGYGAIANRVSVFFGVEIGLT
jgi:hypothetical protein